MVAPAVRAECFNLFPPAPFLVLAMVPTISGGAAFTSLPFTRFFPVGVAPTKTTLANAILALIAHPAAEKRLPIEGACGF